MKKSYAWLIAILAAVSCVTALNAEDAPKVKGAPRDDLRISAGEFNYPGGMLFHTAFLRGLTTRYLLLKAALRSDALNKYLSLDERQRLRVKNLRCVTLDDANRKKLLDENAQPDEQLFDPDYFAFLDPAQLRKLDVLALRFDGYLAISRKSFAERLDLSPQSRERIAKAAIEIRESAFLPRFRWEFAAKLPKDIGYRDCLFAARIGTRLNLTIADALTDRECERLRDVLSETINEDAADAFEAAENLAILPEGINSLITEADRD